MFSYFLCFCTGIFITAIIAYLFHRSGLKNQSAALLESLQQHTIVQNQLQQQVQLLQKEKDVLFTQAAKTEFINDSLNAQNIAYDKLQQEYRTVQNQFTAIKENLKNADEKLALQKEELNKIGDSFKFEFRNLAQNILEEKTRKFTEVNEEKMKAILEPLKNDLGIFKQKVEETYDKESKERFSLGREIENLIKMTQQVSTDANNLTTALKGNNKMQGNWGEMILESLLENSGLTKGREYLLQEFIRDNAGNIIKD